MTNGKMKGGDAKPIRSYKEACTKVDDRMIDTDEEDEEWWRNEGWKKDITVDRSEKVPNIVVKSRNKDITVDIDVTGIMKETKIRDIFIL